jgi:hypothetical protein
LLARGVTVADAQAAVAAIVDPARERARAVRTLQRFQQTRTARAASALERALRDAAATVDRGHGSGRKAHAAAAQRARMAAARKLRDAAFRHLIGRGFPVALVRDLLACSIEGPL